MINIMIKIYTLTIKLNINIYYWVLFFQDTRSLLRYLRKFGAVKNVGSIPIL